MWGLPSRQPKTQCPCPPPPANTAVRSQPIQCLYAHSLLVLLLLVLLLVLMLLLVVTTGHTGSGVGAECKYCCC